MPCYVRDPPTYGIKLATLMKNNPKLGLPLIHGLIILMNPKTGVIETLIEGSSVTAIRTGAICGLATQLLANPEASIVAMIGAGVQARAVLQAICSVRPINKVYLFSRTQKSMQQFEKDMDEITDKIEFAANIPFAVKYADIICSATSTDSLVPLVKAHDIKSNVHINSIGGSTHEALEIDPEILKEALVVVDHMSTILHESGEIKFALKNNYLPPTHIIEIGDLLLKKTKITSSITFFRGEGFALEDLAVASKIYQNAVNKGLGLKINLD
jgi:ornithine cyclodeaminase